LEHHQFFQILDQQLVGLDQRFRQGLWGFQRFVEQIDDHRGAPEKIDERINAELRW